MNIFFTIIYIFIERNWLGKKSHNLFRVQKKTHATSEVYRVFKKTGGRKKGFADRVAPSKNITRLPVRITVVHLRG